MKFQSLRMIQGDTGTLDWCPLNLGGKSVGLLDYSHFKIMNDETYNILCPFHSAQSENLMCQGRCMSISRAGSRNEAVCHIVWCVASLNES